MDNAELDVLLRRYRPVGPGPHLRARILRRARPGRLWPWVGAAAALLLSTIALHVGANRQAARLTAGVDPTAVVFEDLTRRLGGDDAARRLAERIVLEQQIRDESPMPPTQGEPQ
ncbi:MAG TPA: hypothetical protein VF147_12750 [Vicinamibacterales bacterium]